MPSNRDFSWLVHSSVQVSGILSNVSGLTTVFYEHLFQKFYAAN